MRRHLPRDDAVVVVCVPGQPQIGAALVGSGQAREGDGRWPVGEHGQAPAREPLAAAAQGQQATAGQRRVELIAVRVQAVESAHDARELRRASDARDRHRQARPCGQAERRVMPGEQQRRAPRIGRRRDPGGDRGGRRSTAPQQREVEAEGVAETVSRRRSRDERADDQGRDQPAAKQDAVAPGEPRPGQPQPQPAGGRDAPLPMDLPDREGRRIRLRRSVLQRRDRVMVEAGGGLQPQPGGGVIRPADAPDRHAEPDRRGRDIAHQEKRVDWPAQALRQTQQRGAQIDAEDGGGRPEDRPDGLEDQQRAGGAAPAGEPARQPAARSPVRCLQAFLAAASESHSGTVSRDHSAAISCRGLITA